MDFNRAMTIIGKRKWTILASVIITTVLVYGVTRLTPSRWLATVRIITPSGSALSEAVHKVSEMTDMDSRQQAAVYSSIAHSQEVLHNAAAVAHLNEPLSVILKNIEFDASGNRMFELRYFDGDPVRARDMANALADGFIAKNRSLNSQEAERTTDLLDKQLKASERRLSQLHQSYDQYCLDHQIAGDPATQLTTVLKRLETAHASKEATLARVAQEMSQLQHQRNAASSPTIVVQKPAATSERLSRLERQLGDLDDQIRVMRRRYNDTHPEVKELLSQRQQMVSDLKSEQASIKTEKEPNPAFSASTKSVEDLTQLVAGDRALIRAEDANIAAAQDELEKLRTVNGPLGQLTSEITSESENRTGLASRLNTAKAALDVAQRQNPLTVLEYVGASNPPVNTSAGRTQKLILLAALSAFILATGLALAFENLDRRLKTVQQAEELLPARILAAIPQTGEDVGTVEWARAAELRPLSVQSEAYRFLGQHLLSAPNRQYRSLMALSARAGQGSTRTISNLAITLAQAGQRVLLVDANLRHPDLHRVFELPNQFGLTDILREPEPAVIDRAMQSTTLENLTVITSGPSTDNPWELFSSHKLQDLSDYLKGRADYVLYDTPSALAYTDTLSLSGVVDAALLCVRAVDPISGAEQRLGEMFTLSEVQVLGCVLVDAPASFLVGSPAERSGVPRSYSNPTAALIAGPPEPQPAGEMLAGGDAADRERVPNADAGMDAHPLSNGAQSVYAELMPKAADVEYVEPTPDKHEAVPMEPALDIPPALHAEPAPDIHDAVQIGRASFADQAMDAVSAPDVDQAMDVSMPDAGKAMEVVSAPVVEMHAGVAEPVPLPTAPADLTAHAERPSLLPAQTAQNAEADCTSETELESQKGPETQCMDANAHEEPQLDDATHGSGTGAKENTSTMASGSDTPSGGFPRAIHGYAVGPVDDYVRKINARLESLLMQVQVESNRADQSKRVMEQMTIELEVLQRNVIEAEKREMAALDARTRVEEMAARLEEELKAERTNARHKLEMALSEARQQHEALLEERHDADLVIAEARRSTAAQLAEADHLKMEAERLAEERAALKQQLDQVKHAGSSEQLRNTEAQRVRLEAEIEAQRVFARSQIELIVAEARRNAEEAGARAASVYRDHEARVRALGEECEVLVSRIRHSVDAHLSHLPSGAPGNANAGHSEENDLDEKHLNQKRDWRGAEWRTGDWRSAS